MQLPDNVRYIVADTETTDATEQRRVCEVGWVEIDENFNILEQVNSIIDPEHLIAPSASGVHGLTNVMCGGFPTIEEFFTLDHPSCRGRKISGPVALIGHKISFDRPLLEPWIEGGVVQEACSLRWAKRVYPYAEDHKLSSLLYSLNLPTPEGPLAMEARDRYDGAHGTLGDVLVALQLAKHLCERLGMTLRQYCEASAELFFVDVMPMGKHKGKDMTEVIATDKSYLRWMRDNMDMDPDLRHTVETALEKKKKNAE